MCSWQRKKVKNYRAVINVRFSCSSCSGFVRAQTWESVRCTGLKMKTTKFVWAQASRGQHSAGVQHVFIAQLEVLRVTCDQTVYIWFLALVVFILFSLWFRIGAAYTKYLFYLFVCHFCLCDCNSRGQREGLCVWFELLLTYEHNISWQPWADFFKVRTNWLEFIVNAHWKPSVWL